MRKPRPLISPIIAFALLAAASCTRSEPAPTPGTQRASAPTDGAAPRATEAQVDGPILVELFTSQGCSSCPPADRVLTQIGEGAFGDDVIPLAYHVDYWNYIGWRDPFSKKEWSGLQRQYGKVLSSGRVYTPMLVINGRRHVVGSQSSAAKREIEAAREGGARATVAIKRAEDSGSGQLAADVSWSSLSSADLYVAVTESGLETDVKRGENSGRELENDHIVRSLVRVEPRAGENSRRIEIPIEPSWDKGRLKLVVFARDRRSLAVLGAARE